MIGFITEDESDYLVLVTLTNKISGDTRIKYPKFLAHGCGKLRAKCADWAQILFTKGCSRVIICHDLDNKVYKELNTDLEAKLKNISPERRLVLIPIREIESWLLSDPRAIAQAFNENKPPKCPGHPEDVMDPKRHLASLVRTNYKKDYLHTVHNAIIANYINISVLNKCSSFLKHYNFVTSKK